MSKNSLLITGGAGYFGRTIVRHALEAGMYDRICIFSRGEAAQAAMRADFGETDLKRLRWFIGDVRDEARLIKAMHGVEDVVHAAALKRVEVGEYNPDEMVKTNVLGAMNVIRAAEVNGVRRLVALSSDKACAPLNTYGASKLLAEKLFLAAGVIRREIGPIITVVRYGNVSGSTGSVIPIWRQALKQNQPLVITDPDCTRFWMDVQDAVGLVLWALTYGVGGELVVPNLPAYRLGDLLQAMTDIAPLNVGLRPGEKVDEVMISPDEATGFGLASGDADYWVKGGLKNVTGNSIERGLSSRTARRMSVDELRVRLEKVI